MIRHHAGQLNGHDPESLADTHSRGTRASNHDLATCNDNERHREFDLKNFLDKLMKDFHLYFGLKAQLVITTAEVGKCG